ncbi:MAG: protein translocase subunit SecF, partial [Deltaproteobacteria bacterium]|nr:protein translocase subunit SecF [Deltaproteobacteria bacterium]
MFEIIKPGTRYDFLGKSKQLFAISALLMLLSIGAMVTRTVVDGSPLNYGIDFTGGTEIQLSFKDHVPTEQVRQAMSAQGFTPEVQSIDTGGDTFDYLVRIR